MKAIERETGKTFEVKQIEGGYEIYTADGELYKRVKDSTFKRYFKVEKTEKVEEKKATTQPEAAEEITAEKKQQMIEKVKKLMALAENNPSQEEAISAALMAHKIMAKYNIHEDETLEELTDDTIDCSIAEQPSGLMGWRKALAVVVSKAYRCKVFCRGSNVVFRGYKDDADIARDVYLMLFEVGHKISKKTETKARSEKGTAKGVYTSVATGFVKGVSDALNKQCTALMVITPKAVEEDWEEFSKNMKTGRRTNLYINNSEFYDIGYKKGKETVEARQLEDKGV